MAQRSNDMAHRLVTPIRRLGTQKGHGLVEYGLILAAVSIAVVAALLALGGQIGAVVSSVTTALQGL
jgi:Flp pilus assembly pilin Flp